MTTPGPLTRRGLAETGSILADLAHRYRETANEAAECLSIAKRERHEDAEDEVVLYAALLERAEECYSAALTLARVHGDLDYDALTGTLVRNERHGGAGAPQAADVLNGDADAAARSVALSIKLRGTEPEKPPVGVVVSDGLPRAPRNGRRWGKTW